MCKIRKSIMWRRRKRDIGPAAVKFTESNFPLHFHTMTSVRRPGSGDNIQRLRAIIVTASFLMLCLMDVDFITQARLKNSLPDSMSRPPCAGKTDISASLVLNAINLFPHLLHAHLMPSGDLSMSTLGRVQELLSG